MQKVHPTPNRTARRRTRRRLPLATIFFLLISTLFCVGLFALGFALLSLPRFAAGTFGPANPRLNLYGQIRLSAQLLWQSDLLTRPADPFGQPRPFEISLGEPIPRISDRLQADGLIRDASAFRAYLQYAGLDTTLQAGNYTLSPSMTAIEIAHNLQDPTPGEINFNIFKGWRAEEIAAALPTSGLEVAPAEFLAALETRPDGYALLSDLPAEATLEGFVFPGNYRLPRELDALEMVAVFLDEFSTRLTPEILRGFRRQGLDVYQAVTLASIVQRESVVDEEMPLIASVFLNRLAIGMKLDADSTVQYALGYNERQTSWWTNPLSLQDLQIDSPYNTYLYPGLPPGPIANPGLDALRAVAFPARSPYYYFRAGCDDSGVHLFAETFEEHLRNACP